MPADSSRGDELLKEMYPGQAQLSILGRPPGQVAVLVREQSSVIGYLGETGIQLRSGLFPVAGVLVVVLSFRVGRYVVQQYDIWLNYHEPGGIALFQTLAGQELLAVHFHGDNRIRERTCITVNILQDFFADTIRHMDGLPPWDDAAYGAALQATRRLFSSTGELWEALQHNGEHHHHHQS